MVWTDRHPLSAVPRSWSAQDFFDVRRLARSGATLQQMVDAGFSVSVPEMRKRLDRLHIHYQDSRARKR